MSFFDNFNWGEAAMGFFADPEVTAARMKRRQGERDSEKVRAGLKARGLSDSDIDLMMSSPGAAASYIGKAVEPKDPYLPSTEKEAQWYEQNGDTATAADIRAKARMVPVQQADPNTGEVRYQYVRPTTLMGGGSQPAPSTNDLPRISTPGEAAKLPPGSWFIAPDGSRRQVPGGAGSGAPRTFPRPY